MNCGISNMNSYHFGIIFYMEMGLLAETLAAHPKIMNTVQSIDTTLTIPHSNAH